MAGLSWGSCLGAGDVSERLAPSPEGAVRFLASWAPLCATSNCGGQVTVVGQRRTKRPKFLGGSPRSLAAASYQSSPLFSAHHLAGVMLPLTWHSFNHFEAPLTVPPGIPHCTRN